jgi:hypothetical protein
VKRIFMKKFVDFTSAQSYKESVVANNPDWNLQIRRINNGFKVVKRVNS